VCIAQSVIQLSISQIVLMNFIKISLIIKERPGEILIKLAIVLKTSKTFIILLSDLLMKVVLKLLVFQLDFEVFRTIASFIKISPGRSLIIKLIFRKI
jgi:hypothetical protein